MKKKNIHLHGSGYQYWIKEQLISAHHLPIIHILWDKNFFSTARNERKQSYSYRLCPLKLCRTTRIWITLKSARNKRRPSQWWGNLGRYRACRLRGRTATDGRWLHIPGESGILIHRIRSISACIRSSKFVGHILVTTRLCSTTKTLSAVPSFEQLQCTRGSFGWNFKRF